MEKHFESFLQDCMDQGHTQVKLVPRIDDNGKVAFYAVGQCGRVSSETFEAVVEGKHVRRVVDIPAEPESSMEPSPMPGRYYPSAPEPMPIMDEAAGVSAAPTAEDFVPFAATPGEEVAVTPVEDEKPDAE